MAVFLANKLNSLKSSIRSGSLVIILKEDKAAAVFEGVSPTEKTNPGHVYFKYSISSFVPAIYPPQLAKDLLKVPIHISTSWGLILLYSLIPRPVFPSTPMEWASSTISQQS